MVEHESGCCSESERPFVLHYSEEGTRRRTVLPFASAGRHRLVDLQPFPGGGVALTARKETSPGNLDIHLARINAPALPAGMYYCTLFADNVRLMRKLIVLR